MAVKDAISRAIVGVFIRGLCFVLIMVSASQVTFAAREVAPGANLCAEINSLRAGEVLTLLPGDFNGACKIRHSGVPGSPIVIQGLSTSDKPRIVYEGQDHNVFDIIADFVTLRGLRIGPTRRNVAAVRILAHTGITVEDCEFSQLGGIAIAATQTSVDGLYVRRNTVTDVSATAMYFGCHDGFGCKISNLFVERNFIRGVDAPDPEIGYGIQFKLNSTGIISDNVVVGTKGPGIMVYGATDSSRTSGIERNFVSGSRQSSGIVIGGGSVRVYNNIAIENFEGGITLQDYANRGLLRRILIAYNTAFQNKFGEFVVPSEARLTDVVLAFNAAAASHDNRAFPHRQSGLTSSNNIDCSRSTCFANPSSLDFSPISGSLVTRVRNGSAGWLPHIDYYGRNRSEESAAGAIAIAGPAIKLGIKNEYSKR